MMTRSTNTQGTAARLSAFTGMALIFGALALMSHHNGVAEEQNKDRTGAPGQPATVFGLPQFGLLRRDAFHFGISV